MTETSLPPLPPPAPPGPAVPLRRRADDGVFRGVCAAIGRSTSTDPVLWRVVAVVLTVFGGTGLLLYLAGWLLIPLEGEDASIAERRLRRLQLSGTPVLVLVLGAVAVAALVHLDSDNAAPLVVVGALAYLLLRRPAPEAPAAVGWTVPADVPAATAPAAWVPLPPPPPPVARRPRSHLGLITGSAALLAVGLLGLLGLTGLVDVTAGRVLATALAVVGLGLVVGARWGRSRGLLLLAVPLALALGVASAGPPVPVSTGQRTWTVSGPAERRLGAGEAVLRLDPTTTAGPVTARLGLGHLEVHVPPAVHAELVIRVDAGQIQLPDSPLVDGTGLRETRTYGPASAPLVRVEVRVGAGQVEVLDDAS